MLNCLITAKRLSKLSLRHDYMWPPYTAQFKKSNTNFIKIPK